MSLQSLFSNKNRAKKYRKITSVKNWTLDFQPKRRNVFLNHWEPDAEGKSKGTGMSSGARVQQATFKKYVEEIMDYFYDIESDSWFIRTADDVIIRAAWANAFQNPKYPMLKSREEANSILKNVLCKVKTLDAEKE